MKLKRIRNGEYKYDYVTTSFYICRFKFGRTGEEETVWNIYLEKPDTDELRQRVAQFDTLNECRMWLSRNSLRYYILEGLL